MRRLPVPATEYCSFVPLTLQFVTATANSLRAKFPLCRSAAHVQRILRTFVMVTVAPSLSSNDPNGRLICQVDGDTPPAKLADAGAPPSVPAPCTVPYTPMRFPFVPGAPCHVSTICVPLAVALTAPPE